MKETTRYGFKIFLTSLILVIIFAILVTFTLFLISKYSDITQDPWPTLYGIALPIGTYLIIHFTIKLTKSN